jgi:hypothetical protein
MGRELGRISGPLLSANLERDGVDLRFEDDLLYLSVVDTSNPSKKVGVGINKLNPTRDLFVDNTTHTINLVVDTWATVGLTGSQFTIIDNKIQYDGSIVLQPNQTSNPTITTTRVGTKDYALSVNYLNISDKLIENLSTGSNIQLNPSITGITQFDTSEVYVNGSVHSTGSVTFDGDITFGSDDNDSVDFNADVNSHIIPNITNTYDLGAALKRWATVYVQNLYSNNSTVTSQTFGTLTANGSSTFDGNAYLGNASTDQITFTSLFGSSLIPTTSGYTLGTDAYRWNTVFLKNLNIDSVIDIQNNTITTIDFSILDGGSSALTGSILDGGSSALTGPSIISGGDSSVSSSVNLELYASGTGIINVVTTDVEITNDLTVGQLTTLTNVDITGLLDLTGDYVWNHTGTSDRTGNTDITGSLTVNGANTVQFEDIKFVSNRITTTVPNNNLILIANGTGLVKILVTDVEITNDLNVDLTGDINTVNATTVYANAYDIGSVYIVDNTITTNVLNTNLVLSADGAGEIHVITTDVVITNDLEVNQLTTLADVDITGLLDLIGDNTWTQTGSTQRIGNTDITGSLTVNGANTVQFDDVQFVGNIVRTTLGTDLELSANGTGIVKVLTSNVEITNNLDVLGTGYLNEVVVINGVDPSDLSVDFDVGSIFISGNTVTTSTGNLVLSADNTGEIHVTTTDVVITNDLEVNQLTTLADVDITGLLDLTGDYTWTHTGTTQRIGNTDITGSLTVNGANTVQFDDIQFVGNVVRTTLGTDLELSANGTGIVKTMTSDVEITNDLDVLGTGYFNNLTVGAGITNSAFTVGNFYIANNDIITTVGSNIDIILQADGTGKVYAPTNDVSIANDLTVTDNVTVNGNTSLKNTIIRSETLTPTTTQVSQNVSGTSTPTGFFFYGWADDPGQSNPPFGVIQIGWTCVQIPGSVVTVVGDGITNYDITITGGSFASGGFYSFTGDVLTYGPKTLTQTGNIDQTGDAYITGNFNNNNITILSPSYISVPDIKIEDNIIQVTATDNDLELVANGTGGVIFDRYLKITNNEISSIFDPNDIELAFDKLLLAEDGQIMITEAGEELLIDSIVDGDLSIIFVPNGTGNAVIATSRAIAIPYGNNSNRVLAEVGEIRQNSTLGVYEGWTPNGLVSFNGVYDSDKNTYVSPELTPGANDNIIRFGVNGTVKGSIDSTKLYFGAIHVDNVVISGNTINNLISSNDLIINATGNGSVSVNDILIKDNSITNTADTALVIETAGIGYVQFSGNKALVIPAGVDADRRVTPELGETRYNTERSYLEVYDGTNWIAAAGTSAVATEEEIVAETNLWAFILG